MASVHDAGYEHVLLLPGEELDYPLALLGASSCASADPEYFRFCFTFAGLEVAFTAKWPCQADS